MSSSDSEWVLATANGFKRILKHPDDHISSQHFLDEVIQDNKCWLNKQYLVKYILRKTSGRWNDRVYWRNWISVQWKYSSCSLLETVVNEDVQLNRFDLLLAWQSNVCSVVQAWKRPVKLERAPASSPTLHQRFLADRLLCLHHRRNYHVYWGIISNSWQVSSSNWAQTNYIHKIRHLLLGLPKKMPELF